MKKETYFQYLHSYKTGKDEIRAAQGYKVETKDASGWIVTYYIERTAAGWTVTESTTGKESTPRPLDTLQEARAAVVEFDQLVRRLLTTQESTHRQKFAAMVSDYLDGAATATT